MKTFTEVFSEILVSESFSRDARRAGAAKFGPVEGQRGPFEISHRTHQGHKVTDFVEKHTDSSHYKFGPRQPMIYTYNHHTGTLSGGSSARWDKRKLMVGPNNPRAGASEARPNDLAHAEKLVNHHYSKYKPG